MRAYWTRRALLYLAFMQPVKRPVSAEAACMATAPGREFSRWMPVLRTHRRAGSRGSCRMSPPGRIVIYGAGNIGLYLGGRLLEHTPVRFVGRPATANALTEN